MVVVVVVVLVVVVIVQLRKKKKHDNHVNNKCMTKPFVNTRHYYCEVNMHKVSNSYITVTCKKISVNDLLNVI